VILAARPSMGKTAFAMSIAENSAIVDGKVVAIFSLEMSREALLLRLLCSRARVDAHKMRTGSLWRDDMQRVVRAMEELASSRIFIDDTPGVSLSEMRAKAPVSSRLAEAWTWSSWITFSSCPAGASAR